MKHAICDTWGRVTDDESRARRHLVFCIRLCYLDRPPHGEETVQAASDEFAQLVDDQTTLSDAYALLTTKQRKSLRDGIENPPVQYIRADGTRMFLDANLDLLNRLERGVAVGRVGETQIVRLPGAKAF